MTRQVNSAWDLGGGDSTAIWFEQQLAAWIISVCHQTECEGMRHYFKVLKTMAEERGWRYGEHYGPHDITHREFGGDAKSRKQIAAEGFEIDGETYSVDFHVLKDYGG